MIEQRKKSAYVLPTPIQDVEKRKSEAIRQFAAQFTATPVVITPKWQRAIDTYNRVKAEKVTH